MKPAHENIQFVKKGTKINRSEVSLDFVESDGYYDVFMDIDDEPMLFLDTEDGGVTIIPIEVYLRSPDFKTELLRLKKLCDKGFQFDMKHVGPARREYYLKVHLGGMYKHKGSL